MSEMMVLGFENEMEADRFGVKLGELQKDMIVQLSDAAEVVRDPDGKPHVKHGHGLVGAGASSDARTARPCSSVPTTGSCFASSLSVTRGTASWLRRIILKIR